MSSYVSLVVQFNRSFALLVSAKEMAISPFLFFENLYLILTWLVFSNNLTNSKTLNPFPVPKFTLSCFLILGSFFNAIKCASARSRTCM